MARYATSRKYADYLSWFCRGCIVFLNRAAKSAHFPDHAQDYMPSMYRELCMRTIVLLHWMCAFCRYHCGNVTASISHGRLSVHVISEIMRKRYLLQPLQTTKKPWDMLSLYNLERRVRLIAHVRTGVMKQRKSTLVKKLWAKICLFFLKLR